MYRIFKIENGDYVLVRQVSWGTLGGTAVSSQKLLLSKIDGTQPTNHQPR